jgi:hypothetical protein
MGQDEVGPQGRERRQVEVDQRAARLGGRRDPAVDRPAPQACQADARAGDDALRLRLWRPVALVRDADDLAAETDGVGDLRRRGERHDAHHESTRADQLPVTWHDDARSVTTGVRLGDRLAPDASAEGCSNRP